MLWFMKFEKFQNLCLLFHQISQFTAKKKLHGFETEMPLQIQLTKKKNVKVFINEPGDQFWIIRSMFPIHTDLVSIEGW